MAELSTQDTEGVLLVVEEDRRLVQRAEEDFESVLAGAKEVPESEELIKIYNGLMGAVRASMGNENRLADHLRELADEMRDNTAKMQAAIKLSHDDTRAIETLTEDYTRLVNLMDTFKEREDTTIKQIEELKQQIVVTSKLISSGEGAHVNEEETMKEYMELKEKLVADRARNSASLTELRNQLANSMEKLRHVEKEKTDAENKFKDINESISAIKADAAKERKIRDDIEAELDTIRADIKQAETEQQEALEKVKQLSETQKEKEKEYKEQANIQAVSERLYKKELEKQSKAESELNDAKNQLSTLEFELRSKKEELKENEQEVKKVQKETESIRKQLASLRKSLSLAFSERTKLEKEKADLKEEIGKLGLEYDAIYQEHQEQLKAIVSVQRDQSLIKGTMSAKANEMDELKTRENIEKEKVKVAEQEHHLFKVDNQQLRKKIAALELEKKANETKTKVTHQKILQVLQELSMRDMAITDLQERITDAEERIRQQQQSYDAVCADRNINNKNLVETQMELNELNTRFRLMTSTIEQQRNTIRMIDNDISKTIVQRKNLEIMNEKIEDSIQKLQLEEKEGEKVITDQLAEIAKFNDLIASTETENKRQSCKTQDVIIERDNVMNTYTLKLREINKINDELDILDRLALMAESNYSKSVDKLRKLKAEAALLANKFAGLKRKSIGHDSSDKHKLVALEKMINNEKNRGAVLKQEMEQPLNIHKWRQLEGFDHSTYELLRKVQTIQRGLIKKNTDIEEKDREIEAKEAEYRALKNLLAHQPGMEVADQVQNYRETLDGKKKQLTVLANELMSYKNQVDELKEKIKEKQQEIQAAKDRYFDRRRSEFTYIRQKEVETMGTIPAMEYDELLE